MYINCNRNLQNILETEAINNWKPVTYYVSIQQRRYFKDLEVPNEITITQLQGQAHSSSK